MPITPKPSTSSSNSWLPLPLNSHSLPLHHHSSRTRLLLIIVPLLTAFYLGHLSARFQSRTPSVPFRIPPSELGQGPDFPRPDLAVAKSLSPTAKDPPDPLLLGPPYVVSEEQKIPKYLHYVFGLDRSGNFGGKSFGFVQWLAVRSAVEEIKPERVYFWVGLEPDTWWWRQLKSELGVWEGKSDDDPSILRIVPARDVTEIWGRKIEHFAHKADIIRLEALRDHGGIYLDLDIFVVRDFTPLLTTHSAVMAQEANPDPKHAVSGLCNALILAQPYAPFISRWLNSYRDFDKGLWATHSVARPWDLARQHPHEITVLDRHAFFWPLWHEAHIDLVHNSMTYDFRRTGQYAYHAWESLTWDHLAPLDPDRIHIWGRGEEGEPGETSFTRMARIYVGEDVRRKWREARERGEV